jgi:hypothetical protein
MWDRLPSQPANASNLLGTARLVGCPRGQRTKPLKKADAVAKIYKPAK